MARIVILYGSQTGTAEEVALRISREATRRRFANSVHAMDDFDRALLPLQTFVLFVCSTTGQGDEPDNMRQLWRFLCRKSLPADSLANVTFAVFGLGDSSYVKFNFAAKRLFRRLAQLGARPLFDKAALADDQDEFGADSTLEPWLEVLWPRVETLVTRPQHLDVIPPFVLYPSKFFPVFLHATTNQPDVALHSPPAHLAPCYQQQRLYYSLPSQDSLLRSASDRLASAAAGPAGPATVAPAFGVSNPFLATVACNRRITASDHFQDVRHIELDISGSGMSYEAGDVVYVKPENTAANVELLARLLNIALDDRFLLLVSEPDSYQTIPALFPAICSVRELLTKWLDIASVPKRSFFELLSFFAMDVREREKLREFASTEGQEDRYSYCNRVKRTCIEVLQDFPSLHGNIPFQYVFDLFPLIRPRAFSISSAPNQHPTLLHACVAVVQYKTKLQQPRVGLCSNWLAQLTPGCRVPAWIGKGTMRLPADERTPIVMIGPGTGCAPFRAFLQRRAGAGGLNILIFGNRNEQADFLFADEWRQLVQAGRLVLVTAFSRDQPEKVYVQHRMQEPAVARLLWETIGEKGGCVYIAGSSEKMPRDVRDALKAIVQTRGGTAMAGTGGDDSDNENEESAEAYLSEMERRGRLQIETWS